jgi:Arylsulfotransferase (ASST)
VSPVRRPAIALIAGGTALALLAAPVQARVEVSASPGLTPRFEAGITDYVTRCSQHGRLRITVHDSGGDRVAVAGGPERADSFTASVRRHAGARTSIRVRTAKGTARRYSVRCLPPDFPRWTAERHGTPTAQWYVTAPMGRYVVIFDSHGTPVWWERSTSKRFMPWDAKLLDGGRIAWGRNYRGHFGTRKEGGYEVRRLDGRLTNFVRTVGSPTDEHDLELLPGGHFLALTYRPRDHVDLSPYGGPADARVFDGEIQELTPSGKVVWHWNSAGHVSPSETGRTWWYNESAGKPPPGERGWDLLHINSIEPDGDGLIVSARHLNAVFRIDRATGDIDWKLGGTFVAGESLTALGVPFGENVLFGQHDARLWKDGTLTVFDNRSYTDAPPSLDRFRVDPVARTARRIESLTDPAVPESNCCGSARKLPGGNWVVAWGGTGQSTELSPGGSVLLSLHLGPYGQAYRTIGVPPGEVSAAQLRRGMDRMARADAGG